MDMKETARDRLARAGWLGSAHLAAPLVAAGGIRRVRRGAWVQAEGDADAGIVVVLEGALDLYCHGLGQRQQRIGLVGPGSAFGQSPRFGGGPRLVTAVAATASLVLTVADDALARLAEERPDVSRAISALVYRQLRHALQSVADMLGLPPTQRLAARLVALAEVNLSGAPLPLTQQALAEMTGLGRKSVNAILGQFEAAGAVQCSYRSITITRPEALALIAQQQ